MKQNALAFFGVQHSWRKPRAGSDSHRHNKMDLNILEQPDSLRKKYFTVHLCPSVLSHQTFNPLKMFLLTILAFL